jgi:hypothetical protein
MLLVHGTADPTVPLSQSETYLKIAKEKGIKANLLAKLEFFNPIASVKDRIGVHMISVMEAAGKIAPGKTTLIEPTSGNTGVGLALVAQRKGYRCVFVCPDTGKRYDIFGTGGARRTAQELEIPFLGEVPIQIPIREHGDAGTTAANYDDPAARPYLESICQRLVGNLAAAHAIRPPLPSLPVL